MHFQYYDINEGDYDNTDGTITDSNGQHNQELLGKLSFMILKGIVIKIHN